MKKKIIFKRLILLLGLINVSFADSFENNFYNNHGSVGLINIPVARFFDEGVHGITLYDGTPDQKITLTSNPFNWLEASFFYTNIQGVPYPGFEYQDYKDKGFNLKIRLKKEGILPAIAIGLNDFAGTGYYSSEYLVSSYGVGNIDMHFGLGWGTLNDFGNIKNPFSYLGDGFSKRPKIYEGMGGAFNTEQYFSGAKTSLFYGISYHIKEDLILHFEKDPTLIQGSRMPYPIKDNDYSLGFKYNLNKNLTLGLSHERGNYLSFNFTYKNDPENTKKNMNIKKLRLILMMINIQN